MSQDEIRDMITSAVSKALASMKKDQPVDPPTTAGSLMKVKEICEHLNIGRTNFEHYKAELISAGMFKMGRNNSSYLMKREDFEKWISTKQEVKRGIV